METWQERLFELIRLGDGFVACKGGTGTLVELAVVWEMLNKGVMAGKPFVTLGDFWAPILERVREVEAGSRLALGRSWGAAGARRANSRRGRGVSGREAAGDAQSPQLGKAMATPAEEILEFDRLRELLRRPDDVCAGPARDRGVGVPTERAALEREFAAMREAIAYLRTGREIGFGGSGRSANRGSSGWTCREPVLGSRANCWTQRRWRIRRRGCANFFSEALREISAAYRARAFAGGFSRCWRRRSAAPFCPTAKSATMLRRSCGASAAAWRARGRRFRRRWSAFCARRGGAAGEDYVTLRNDRFVIPVRASERRSRAGRGARARAPRARRFSSSRSKPSS